MGLINNHLSQSFYNQTEVILESKRQLDTNIDQGIEGVKQELLIDFPSENIENYGSFANTKELISYFNSKWNWELNKFNPIPFDSEKFSKLLELNNSKFTKNIADDDFGYIEKRDLPARTKIFARADLHGDLKSLIENITTLRNEGLLDEQFRCKPGVQLVFLGDYVDRGSNTMEVLQLLITLRVENPEQVILIRGNHESIHMNVYYAKGDQNFQQYLSDKGESAKNSSLLTLFYQTLPLTVYLSEQNGQGERQYVQFTHGLFELHMDPQAMLNNDPAYDYQNVPKKRELSYRVSRIETDLCAEYQEILDKIEDKHSKRIMKQKIAAKQVNALIEQEKNLNQEDREITTYNWGDMSNELHSSMGEPGQRKWKLTINDVKHYLRLSSLEHPVKMIFRGHEHRTQYHLDDKGKVIVTTLPVGMDSGYYSKKYPNQLDTVFILETALKVKEWTKYSYLRVSGRPTEVVTEPVSIRNSGIMVLRNSLKKSFS